MSSTPPPSAFAEGEVVAGRWRILAQIAEGGMGTVYRAEHVRSHRAVALKALKETASEEARQRMLREARLAARIEHPNVVSIFDVDVVDQVVFLVMELLRGETLDDWMEARAGAPREEPAPFLGRFLPALAGLAEMHRQGIVHRDFKPENIFLADYPDGQTITKLLDLGIARDQHATSLKLTSPESLIGTPAYMAPEQVQGDEASLALDVFAAGVVLYEGLAGSRPFPATNVFSLVHEIVEKDPVPLQERCPELPAELCAVVMRCLEKEPAERFEDARALLDALQVHAPRDTGPISVPPRAESGASGSAGASDGSGASGSVGDVHGAPTAGASDGSGPSSDSGPVSTPPDAMVAAPEIGAAGAPARGERWVFALVALGVLFLGVAAWSASAREGAPDPEPGRVDATGADEEGATAEASAEPSEEAPTPPPLVHEAAPRGEGTLPAGLAPPGEGAPPGESLEDDAEERPEAADDRADRADEEEAERRRAARRRAALRSRAERPGREEERPAPAPPASVPGEEDATGTVPPAPPEESAGRRIRLDVSQF